MNVLMGSFQKSFSKLYFEILMDGCFKYSSNIFSRTPMDASKMDEKKTIQKCLDNLVNFQGVFKMCRKTMGTETKLNDRYSSKQNWAREKHLNKQIVQRLQGLKNVH